MASTIDVRVGARADVGEHHADDVVGDARDARQVGARFGQILGDDLRRGLEQAVGERRSRTRADR